jgi:hypothetical protein
MTCVPSAEQATADQLLDGAPVGIHVCECASTRPAIKAVNCRTDLAAGLLKKMFIILHFTPNDQLTDGGRPPAETLTNGPAGPPFGTASGWTGLPARPGAKSAFSALRRSRLTVAHEFTADVIRRRLHAVVRPHRHKSRIAIGMTCTESNMTTSLMKCFLEMQRPAYHP